MQLRGHGDHPRRAEVAKHLRIDTVDFGPACDVGDIHCDADHSVKIGVSSPEYGRYIGQGLSRLGLDASRNFIAAAWLYGQLAGDKHEPAADHGLTIVSARGWRFCGLDPLNRLS